MKTVELTEAELIRAEIIKYWVSGEQAPCGDYMDCDFCINKDVCAYLEDNDE